jgi:hypothetical protein
MNTHNFFRVGTQILKKINQPMADGSVKATFVKWTKDTLITDNLREVLYSMPKYDGFCNIPEHIVFKQAYNGFYNKYHQIEFRPKKGCCDNTLKLVEHIFGEQKELGLDYLKLLLEKPIIKLPILCLVSKKRNTGKSTLAYLIKILYEQNVIFIDNEALNSNFNSVWSDSLVAIIEETLLTKRNNSERIKNLSTAFNAQKESKGIDREESEIFTKFILCSNNENDLVYIEPGETRYWIRKILPLNNIIPEFKDKLQAEKQHFFHFLINRPFSTACKSRMWFDEKLLVTDALKRVILYSRNSREFEAIEIVSLIFDEFQVDQIEFILNDIFYWLKVRSRSNLELFEIKKIIQDSWQLPRKSNSLSYERYIFQKNGKITIEKSKGRCYLLTKERFKEIDDMMNN